MNVRQIAIIGGALVVAGVAFVWMRSQAANQSAAPVIAPAADKPAYAQVLVAKRDLQVGERVSPESLGWQDWPTSTASNEAFFMQTRTPDAIKSFENAVVRQAMVAGEPVTPAKIVVVGTTTSSMAALLTPGMRATAVSITPDSSVAGFVLPNDRVDIVLTREVQISSGGQTISRTLSATILENVRVLAIDQAVAQAKDQKALAGSTATVELSATDAEKLRLANKLGDISLLLRGYADSAGPTLARVDSPVMAQISPNPPGGYGNPAPKDPSSLPNPAAPPQQTAQNAAAAVKVYRGGQ